MKYLVLLLLLTACENKLVTPVNVTDSKDNFEVVLLFKKGKCSVFRFNDNYRYHYFTDCTSTLSAKTESCGKNCNRTYTEEISGSK